MKKIKIHSNKYPDLFALVDDEDYEMLNKYRWNVAMVSVKPLHCYPQANVRVGGKRTVIKMSRLLMFGDVKTKARIEFKDYDGLNCQKKNLIVVEPGSGSIRKHRGSVSGMRGVSF